MGPGLLDARGRPTENLLEFQYSWCGVHCPCSDDDNEMMELVPTSHDLFRSSGVSAPQVQIQKASFFAVDDEYDDYGKQKDKSNFFIHWFYLFIIY